MIEMTLTGLDKTEAAMKRYLAWLERAIPRELKIEAEIVMTESQAIVPVDTGYLRSTGWVGQPYKTGDGWDIKLGYSAVYAARQHYDLTYEHPHGEALFLEKPMKRARGRMQKRMARLARKSRKAFR